MLTVLCPSPLLARVLPDGAAAAEVIAFKGRVRLDKEDVAHVRNAGARRRDEFAAGRLCAAAALGYLGSHSRRVGRDPVGAPIFPPGTVGSISHTDDLAIAVAAGAAGFQTIGLDIECVGTVERSLWRLLFTENEHSILEKVDSDRRGEVATSLFTAKEAFYKAQWPVTREWLDFLDIEIELKGDTFGVRPRATKSWIDDLEPLSGRLVIHEDIAAALVWSKGG